MKIAYLIITHNMPDHLGRIIHALSDENTEFFVHVNQKTSIEPFLTFSAPNVYFLQKRLSVYWGEWQFVEAALHLMQEALRNKRHFDYYILLSGSCFPIRSKEYIERKLAITYGDQYISAVQMPSMEAEKSLSRLDRFYIRSDQSWLESGRRFAADYFPRPSYRLFSRHWWLTRNWRRVFGSLVPYGGSAWWALTDEACRYIQDFVKREQALVRFFENSWIASEMFFQTILANSPFAPKMRRSLTYTDWSAGGCHPAEISEQHVKMFAQRCPLIEDGIYEKGEKCFARKFPDDGGRMANLMDKLVRCGEYEHWNPSAAFSSVPIVKNQHSHKIYRPHRLNHHSQSLEKDVPIDSA